MAHKRRAFLKATAFTGLSALLPATSILAFNGLADAEGFVTGEADQETWLIGPRRAPLTFMVDKKGKNISAVSFCREEIVPGDGIPVHKHLNEEELVYIQYGSGLFTLGEKEYSVTADLRMVFGFTPSGFENYFREIGTRPGEAPKTLSDEEWQAIDKKYGIVYKPR